MLPHELADDLERAIGPRGLPVIFDDTRRKARGCPPLDEARAFERGTHGLGLLGREDVGDRDVHQVSLAARDEPVRGSNTQCGPPGKSCLSG